MISVKEYQAKDRRVIRSVHVDCMSDLLDLDNSEVPSINQSAYRSHSNVNKGRMDSKWFGKTNQGKQSEVIRHAVIGDDALLSRVQEMGRVLDNFPHGNYEEIVSKVVRKRVRSDQGDEIDIHKVYSGQLDKAWSKMVRIEEDKVHRLITLMVDVGANAVIDAEQSLWNAAVSVRVADALIKAGKSVRIIVGSTCDNLFYDRSNALATTSVVVKQYNEPLSMSRLAAMSHAGFHRSFNFPARCLFDQRISSNMGSSVEAYNRYAPAHIKEDVDKGHTRYIYLGRSYNERQARFNIQRASQQLLEEMNHAA